MGFISNKMFVVKKRIVWYLISTLLFVGSFYAIYAYGWNLSIDFKGGTITEVKFAERPAQSEIEEAITDLELGGFSVRPSGDSNYTIRTRELTGEERQQLSSALGNPVVERQNTIGPIAGSELKDKAMKKAKSDGTTYSRVLKEATQAYVEDQFKLGLVYSQQFIRRIRKAESEPTMRGDLRKLIKKY